MGLTPLATYYVIYLAYLEKYNQNTKPINLFKTLRFQVPYSVAVLVILLALVIVWYIIGLPLGFGGVTTSV